MPPSTLELDPKDLTLVEKASQWRMAPMGMGRIKWRMQEISIATMRRGTGWLCMVEVRS